MATLTDEHAIFLLSLDPQNIYAAHHFTKIWLKVPLAEDEHRIMKANCAHFSAHAKGAVLRDAEGKIIIRKHDSWRKRDGVPIAKRGDIIRVHLNQPFNQQLHINGANRKAREALLAHDDRIPNIFGNLPKRDPMPPLIISNEIALELIFSNEMDLLRAHEAFAHCLVQPWNSDHNRYSAGYAEFVSTGRRWRGKFQVLYTSHSRVTGELNCLRHEERAGGAQAVRDSGILSLKDWAYFDFTERADKRLSLFALDKQRWGRFDRNRATGAKRQLPDDDDLHTGRMLWRVHGYDLGGSGTKSIQSVVVSYGRGPFLTRLSVPHLRPPRYSSLDEVLY